MRTCLFRGPNQPSSNNFKAAVPHSTSPKDAISSNHFWGIENSSYSNRSVVSPKRNRKSCVFCSTPKHRQAIFAGPRRVQRVERIAKNVGVPELALHASRCIIRLLIRRRRQPCDEQVVILLLEGAGRVGQNIRETSGRHLDIEVFQELANLGLTHVAAVLERQDQGAEVSTKVAAIVASRERSSIILLLRRRVENMPLELCVLWFDFDVLHDDDFIIDADAIGWQCLGIYRTLDGLMNGDIFERAAVVCLWLSLGLPSFFGRMIRDGLLVVARIFSLIVGLVCRFVFLFLIELLRNRSTSSAKAFLSASSASTTLSSFSNANSACSGSSPASASNRSTCSMIDRTSVTLMH